MNSSILFISGIIKTFLKNTTLQNSGKIFLGKALGLGFLFLCNVILARGLEPEAFGVFSICLTIMAIQGRALGGGIDAGLVKFTAQFHTDFEKISCIFKIAFFSKLGIQVLIVAVGTLASEWIAEKLLGSSDFSAIIILSLFGALAVALFDASLAYFQAIRRFSYHAMIDLCSNLSKLCFVGIFAGMGIISLDSAVWIYVISTLVFLLFSLFIIKDIFSVNVWDMEIFKNFFHFIKWMFFITALVALTRRSGVFFIGYFQSVEEVASYSAALITILPVELILNSLIIVFFPSVAIMKTREEFHNFFREELMITIPITIILLTGTFLFGHVFITLIYSSAYSSSIIIFKILMVGISISLIFSPFGLVVISLDNPRYILLVEGISFILVIILSLACVPRWGGVGSAWAFTASRMIASLLFVSGAKKAISTI